MICCFVSEFMNKKTKSVSHIMIRYITDFNVLPCLIWHIKGPGKCVGLNRMSEYSGFNLLNRNTLEPWIFFGCHRMSENSEVGLHKFPCTNCRQWTESDGNIFCRLFTSRSVGDLKTFLYGSHQGSTWIHSVSIECVPKRKCLSCLLDFVEGKQVWQYNFNIRLSLS
jgi:hypothetical protein